MGMRSSDMDRHPSHGTMFRGCDTFTRQAMIWTTTVPDGHDYVDTDISHSNQLFKPYHPNVKYG